MKKLIFCLTLLASPAFAETETDTVLTDQYCESVGRLAKVTMGLRQQGVSLSAQMKVVAGAKGNVKQIMQLVTLDAYDTPRWITDERKARAVEDFQIEWEVECYRSFYE